MLAKLSAYFAKKLLRGSKDTHKMTTTNLCRSFGTFLVITIQQIKTKLIPQNIKHSSLHTRDGKVGSAFPEKHTSAAFSFKKKNMHLLQQNYNS